MEIEATNPETGKTQVFECQAESFEDLNKLVGFDLTEGDLKKRINRLDVSADAKSLLFSVARTTLRIGDAVVQVGRKILDLIVRLISDNPRATMGTIFGVIFGQLVASVPILGFLLGPLVAPLAIAMGFAYGVMEDIRDRTLARRVAECVAQFDGLKSGSA